MTVCHANNPIGCAAEFFGLAVVGLALVLLYQVAVAYSRRRHGRLKRSFLLKDGRRRLKVTFRDRTFWVVGRDSEWWRGGERCSAELESWLATEWPRLERKRVAREAKRYAERFVRPADPELDADTDDFLASSTGEDDENDDPEQLTIHGATL